MNPSSDRAEASFLCPTLDCPAPLRDLSPVQDMNCIQPTAAYAQTAATKEPGQAYCHGGGAVCETLKQQTTDNPAMPTGQLPEQGGLILFIFHLVMCNLLMYPLILM